MHKVFHADIVTNGEQVVSLGSVRKLQEWLKQQCLDPKNIHMGSRYPHFDLPDHLRHKPLPRAELVGKDDLVRILIGEGLITESRQFGNNICLSDQSTRRWPS